MRMKISTLAVVTLVGTFMLPVSAQAQQSNWVVDARTGFSLVTGDLTNLENLGLNAAVGIERQLSPAVALRVDGMVEFLNGKDGNTPGVLVPEGVPDMTLTSLLGGVDLLLTPVDQHRWRVTTNFGIGITRIKTDDNPVFETGNTPAANYSKTSFSAIGGMHFGYRVAPRVDLTVGGDVHFIATSKKDTEVFTNLSSLVEDGGFSNAWSFPVQVGVKVSL